MEAANMIPQTTFNDRSLKMPFSSAEWHYRKTGKHIDTKPKPIPSNCKANTMTNITGKVALLSTIIGAMLGASIIGCESEEAVLVAEYPATVSVSCRDRAIEAQGDDIGFCCDDSAAEDTPFVALLCVHDWRIRCNEVAVYTSDDVYMPGGVSCFQDDLTWVCCENQ